MTRIALCVGEPSGDRLAAALIQALKARAPGLTFEGIGGPCMAAAGCEIVAPLDRLSVMGLTEVLGRIWELKALRDGIRDRWLAAPPALFLGVDAPDFNLGLEVQLRAAGIRTAHYVSPSVWAWRRGRIKTIAAGVDLMLTLFPFEEPFYRDHGVPAICVGHPAADLIPLAPEEGAAAGAAARAALGLPAAGPILALLPGSRGQEWRHHLPLFLAAARRCQAEAPGLTLVAAAVNAPAAAAIQAAVAAHAPGLALAIPVARTAEVLAACDLALVVSGTATLETMLWKRPMVVAYRTGWLTYLALRPFIRVPFIALPNLLAGERLVPELVQGAARPEALAAELLAWLADGPRRARYAERALALHQGLRRGAAARAAEALLALLPGVSADG